MKKNVTLKIGASALALVVGASGVWADYTTEFPDPNTERYSTNSNTADGEGIENVVTVTGSFTANGTTTNVKDNAFANVDVVTASADIEVKKEAKIDNAAIPTTGAAVDDKITYTYTVKNAGNVTLANVNLEDSHISASGTQVVKITDCSTTNNATTTVTTDATNGDTISPFGPGDSVTCTFEYTVTQADVDQLQVTP